MTNEYEESARRFLSKTNTEFSAKFLKNDIYFDDDKEKRDIYEITLKRGEREYKFRFGNSIANSCKYLVFPYKHPGVRECFNDLSEAKRKYGYISPGEYRENKEFEEPTPYDVLAAVQKYDVGTFEDFAGEFGYDTDSRKAENTYHAVLDEYKNLQRLFNDEEIEELGEIQ